MIKHVGNELVPLCTAEERVTNAFNKVTSGKRFTEAQRSGLEKIREYLNANLVLDMEDFQIAPALADFGGWGKANHIFGHRLIEILNELNEAIAT